MRNLSNMKHNSHKCVQLREFTWWWTHKIEVPQPVYFDTGLGDGRMVFVLPRENKTYFGTTDTDYTGDLEHPKVTQEDVDYLLGIVKQPLPQKQTLLLLILKAAGLVFVH